VLLLHQKKPTQNRNKNRHKIKNVLEVEAMITKIKGIDQDHFNAIEALGVVLDVILILSPDQPNYL
jgi:hypothetical protein